MPEAEPPRAADDLDLIASAAEEGGRIAMRHFRRDPQVWMKSGHSPVSEADLAVDRFLRETLLAARPGYGWLSEETMDSTERLGRRRTFVVDPIDGTRAFVAGWTTWCVSVAVVEDGRSHAGVLACPALDETFVAARGGGACLNGARITVRAQRKPLQVTGPMSFLDHLPMALREGVERMPHVPSLAYRVAMIAKGALDATFVKAGAHDWDLAAAALILEEAGGGLRGPQGRHVPFATSADPRHPPLVGASGNLLDAAVSALEGWRAAEAAG